MWGEKNAKKISKVTIYLYNNRYTTISTNTKKKTKLLAVKVQGRNQINIREELKQQQQQSVDYS